MSIKQLNQKSIGLINSTQAISSVSSAIKELVENSLDAQAQNIQVNLIDKGLFSIEVKDSGTGISKENAPYMALPFYTSKITNFSDLDTLKTYGFRGQALNAACQLSDVTVCTKIEDDEAMTKYLLSNEGKIVTSDLIHGSTGTIVQIKNLFKNVPVRRTNMKKRLNQEIKDAEMLLKTYSICQPSVGFRLNVDSKTIFSKNTCKDVFQAFRDVIGAQTFSKLACIKKCIDKWELMLFVPKKENIDCTGISRSGYQFICINNRPIKSKEIEKLINKRISEYFGQHTSSSKFIFCLILAVDPSTVDVNLEPNKDKVFLQNMAAILKEIDNLLYNIYGSQGSPVSKQDEIANKVFDMNLDESQKEKDGPPSKKRRLNVQNRNICKAYANTRNTKTNIDKTTRKSNDHFLKVTDDSSMSNDNVAKSKVKNQEEKRIDELMEFQEDEVLEVDLGPEFDLQEILNKNKTTLIPNLKEPHPDGSASSVSHDIDDVTWSKGQGPWLQGGVVICNHEILNGNNRVEVGFNAKETVVRRDLDDTSEVDAYMRDYEEWTEIPPGKTNQPIQNVSSISCAQTSRKQKSLNFSSLLTKKTKTQAFENGREKNKMKKFEVPNEIIKKRNFVCWTINPRLVSESCRRIPAEKLEKSIVGSLSSSAWILNWNEQLLLFKTTKLHSQWDSRKYNKNKSDVEYVQYIVDRWFNEKNDMSIFHALYSMKK